MNADFILILYSCLKAFLPLPSLEAVFIPLCLAAPKKSIYYALISGIGTFIGANIGYELSVLYGRKMALKFVGENKLQEGEIIMEKYGVLAVIVGSISPFPDFLLAYLAGISKMNRWLFLFLDGGCRMLRSLLVAYSLTKVNEYVAIEKYSTILSFLILGYFIVRYIFKKE